MVNNVKCDVCGKEMYRRPSTINMSKTGKFFCSKHINTGNKRPDLSKRNKESAHPKKDVKCKKCGELMLLRKNSEIQYCSQICYHLDTYHNRAKGKTWLLSDNSKLNHSLSQLGEKNHNWKGGCVPRPRMRFTRKQILKRDNFKCGVCGLPGSVNYRGKFTKRLVVHHIDSYDKYSDKRLDETNLVTLCTHCHKDFHKKYGYGNNTKKQFKKWLLTVLELEIESISVVKKKTAKIYNISIEGDTTFYANSILTHNTAPHIIEAKNAKALHWKSGGKDFFAKKVNHPGTAPNPFIRRTFFSKFNGFVNQAAMIAEREVNLI